MATFISHILRHKYEYSQNHLITFHQGCCQIAIHNSRTRNHILRYSWASYQIRKIAGCACAGNAGNVFPRRRFQRKPLVSYPSMHHGTCVTHVPWCMSGSLTCGDGENVPSIPGACAPAIVRIWQEAHCTDLWYTHYKISVYQHKMSFRIRTKDKCIYNTLSQ